MKEASRCVRIPYLCVLGQTGKIVIRRASTGVPVTAENSMIMMKSADVLPCPKERTEDRSTLKNPTQDPRVSRDLTSTYAPTETFQFVKNTAYSSPEQATLRWQGNDKMCRGPATTLIGVAFDGKSRYNFGTTSVQLRYN